MFRKLLKRRQKKRLLNELESLRWSVRIRTTHLEICDVMITESTNPERIEFWKNERKRFIDEAFELSVKACAIEQKIEEL